MSRPSILRALRRALPLGVMVLFASVGLARASMLDPRGPVADIERELFLTTLGVMMIVVVPVWIMAFVFVRKYRASNPDGDYRPEWISSRRVEAVVWLVPAAIVVTLGAFVWIYTHKLDPYRSLAEYDEVTPTQQPVLVQVVAQDWKWLFLYPQYGVAAVNELVFPAGAEVRLELTSDTVMNAFFIPQLGSQIYAMAGMETQLNLLAWEPGTFTGRNSQFSGSGFPEQHFEAHAVSEADFSAWIDRAMASGRTLDVAAYAELLKPSISHPVTLYASFEEGLFDRIVESYMSPMSAMEREADN